MTGVFTVAHRGCAQRRTWDVRAHRGHVLVHTWGDSLCRGSVQGHTGDGQGMAVKTQEVIRDLHTDRGL